MLDVIIDYYIGYYFFKGCVFWGSWEIFFRILYIFLNVIELGFVKFYVLKFIIWIF